MDVTRLKTLSDDERKSVLESEAIAIEEGRYNKPLTPDEILYYKDELAVRTTHKLDFEACPWERDPSIQLFRIGTCHGQWYSTAFAYCIISIVNNKPGNGHLQDVFEWFINSCKRDKKALRIREFSNTKFKKHCIEKRGFMEIPGTDDVIKIFV